jgi:hypothetical protein
VRERRGDLGKIASGSPPPLCPSARRQGEERGEGNASKGRAGGRLGFAPGRLSKERRREERMREEEVGGLAEFCLNFERFKNLAKCW